MSHPELFNFTFSQTSSPAGISFCEICNKPFSEEGALKRHVSYCRRARTRPRVRPKPCQECSAAKCKCSLQPRCARCTKKGLDCVYPGTTNQPLEGNVNASGQTFTPEASSSVSSQSSLPIALQIFPNDEHLTWGTTSHSFDSPQDLLFQEMPHFDTGLGFTSAKLNTSVANLTLAPEAYKMVMSTCVNRDKYLNPVAGEVLFPLQFLCSVNPVAESSANMIRQALRSYPQMMLRRSTFPPFIHPHQDKTRLPEPLANCMSIAVLFDSRNQDTRPFLWKSVREEQERNLREMTSYTKYDMFACLQAELIYIIMRVIDGGSGSSEDRDYNTDMLLTYEALWKNFMMATDTSCNVESDNAVTWEDWILDESRTRIASVWFLVAQVASVKIGISCVVLETWKELPLPCHKAQWAATTRESWEEETYALRNHRKRGPNPPCFEGLLRCHQNAGEAKNAERLDVWNAGADSIGNLLNLATTMM
ncbi:hypothetical protein EsH8_V_000008 [Colletotrichum jinshuiense]